MSITFLFTFFRPFTVLWNSILSSMDCFFLNSEIFFPQCQFVGKSFHSSDHPFHPSQNFIYTWVGVGFFSLNMLISTFYSAWSIHPFLYEYLFSLFIFILYAFSLIFWQDICLFRIILGWFLRMVIPNSKIINLSLQLHGYFTLNLWALNYHWYFYHWIQDFLMQYFAFTSIFHFEKWFSALIFGRSLFTLI